MYPDRHGLPKQRHVLRFASVTLQHCVNVMFGIQEYIKCKAVEPRNAVILQGISNIKTTYIEISNYGKVSGLF